MGNPSPSESKPGRRQSEGPRFYQRTEESPLHQACAGRDPSLRL